MKSAPPTRFAAGISRTLQAFLPENFKGDFVDAEVGAACVVVEKGLPVPAEPLQREFWTNLAEYCGRAFGNQQSCAKAIYRTVAQHLARKDKKRFLNLPKEPLATTKRGNPMIANQREGMRVAEVFAEGLYFEVNLSANMIRDAIQRLLAAFAIPDREVTLYLREDRDAE